MPQVADLFNPPFFRWLDPAYEGFLSSDSADDKDKLFSSVDDALDYLDDLVAEEGPFDGVLGFSEGASLATAYLLRLAHRDQLHSTFRFSLLFASGGFDMSYLQQTPRQQGGSASSLRAPGMGTSEGWFRKLDIPTLHVIGDADELREKSSKMVQLWQAGSAIVVDHPDGHVIPKNGTSLARISAAVKALMQSIES